MEERVLIRFEAAPSSSTRAVLYEFDICQSLAGCIVLEDFMPPYHVQRVKSLSKDDYPRRPDFLRLMLGLKNNDP
ncbi:hypothetical protein TNCV_28361 [Trichonephila clavipes]|uniref:Uncharacterized protein n=1 Tax=Trichonephila clavipes TaxID=2585209 RepID=A0A8X7BNC5_TRICX|nr:hypothetical protein TNCV_28361 [Trichonephila clavipes]